MIKEQKDKLDSTPTKKGRNNKKKEEGEEKGLGLFDHIKHIRTVQDPEYFDLLTEMEKKSFTPFQILRGLSMNPELLDNVSTMYRYFDKIPKKSLYKLFIGGMVPIEHPRSFHPWIKSKKFPVSDKIINLISTYFQISTKEAKDYARIILTKIDGIQKLEEFCKDYGWLEKEIKEAMKGVNEEN